MKRVFFILSFILSGMAAHAQNEVVARMEMEYAEKAYSENRFREALEALQKAESLLGKWTGKVSHLKILALDRICIYGDLNNTYFTQLDAEIKKYLDYANKNADDVIMDRVREVYEINKKVRQVAEYVAELEPFSGLNDNTLLERSHSAYEKGDLVTALEYAMALALRGNSTGMCDVGTIYYDGENGVPKNIQEAKKWWLKAAEQGLAKAMYYAGFLYYNDEGDKSNALKWYEKAAENGHVVAMYNAGILYYDEGDKSNALKWYEKAVENGYVKAMYKIGTLYYDEDDTDNALKWWIKAAENGNVNAMYNTGTLYHIAGDAGNTVKWYEKMLAANGDNNENSEEVRDAMYTLYMIYVGAMGKENTNYSKTSRIAAEYKKLTGKKISDHHK